MAGGGAGRDPIVLVLAVGLRVGVSVYIFG